MLHFNQELNTVLIEANTQNTLSTEQAKAIATLINTDYKYNKTINDLKKVIELLSFNLTKGDSKDVESVCDTIYGLFDALYVQTIVV